MKKALKLSGLACWTILLAMSTAWAAGDNFHEAGDEVQCEEGEGKLGSNAIENLSATFLAQWTPMISSITLDDSYFSNSSASGVAASSRVSPTTVYSRYDDGVYNSATNAENATQSGKISGVTIPVYDEYIFRGFYTTKGSGTGTQMITQSGAFTDAAKTVTTNSATWYAYYEPCTCNLGTHVMGCVAIETTADNRCKYEYSCADGYTTVGGVYDGEFLGAVGVTNNTSPDCGDAVSYGIEYTMNGGVNYTNAPAAYTYGVGTTIDGVPTHPHATFAGWTGSNGTTPQTTVTISTSDIGAKAYTANWTCDEGYTGTTCGPKTYVIRIEKNGGSGTLTVNEKTATGTDFVAFECRHNESNIVLPNWNASTNNITKQGSVFTGWARNGTSVSGTLVCNDNMTIQAQWEACASTMENTKSVSLKNVSDNKCSFDYVCKDGYHSSADVTSATGSYSGSAGVANVTPNQSCDPSNVTIHYDSNGGSSVVDGSCTLFNGAFTLPPAPTKTGYRFAGWLLQE